MNESIDLTKILKDCSIGTKLYTPVWGEVLFRQVNNENQIYPICIETRTGRIGLTKEGHYLNIIDADCVLFPSKDQRDWSKFTAPGHKKESNTIEQSQTNERTWLYLVSDVFTWKDGIGQYLDDPEVQEIAKRLCNKYAQKLCNPSVISNSSNIRKDKKRFDPHTLQPFDKVLVIYGEFKWKCRLFSHIDNNEDRYKYDCCDALYEYCIPYNDDTKHLVGTAEEAPEYYRYWED